MIKEVKILDELLYMKDLTRRPAFKGNKKELDKFFDQLKKELIAKARLKATAHKKKVNTSHKCSQQSLTHSYYTIIQPK